MPIRPVLQIVLHFLVPVLVVYGFRMQDKRRAVLILWSTMLVDLDHLLADPIYDPDRSSIGFHPLHSYAAIAVYVLLMCYPPARLVALGLLIHMALDFIDSLFMP